MRGEGQFRGLRRSLWYGLKDLVAELAAQDGNQRLRLRPLEFLAVDDVSFSLERGECVGLLGANGAGKSTLLKMLNGLIRPDAGCIEIQGRMQGLIELGTGFSPVLTGRENIYVNGAILGFSKREMDARFDEIVEFAELQDFIDSPVQSYSTGMHARLAMAVAAHMQAEFLLVDEVLAVGDTAFRMKCFQHFLDLKKAGKSIVVVSHNMIDIARVCDRVIVLHGGRKLYDGAVSAGIATHEEVLAKRSGLGEQRQADAPAEIEQVQLLNARSKSCNDFLTGDDLHVEVILQAKRWVPEHPNGGSCRKPALGILGAFASPHKGFSFDISATGTVIRFTHSESTAARG